MWTNEYKAPWHTEMDKFYQADKKTNVDYLHSIGAKYDFKNDLVLEARLVSPKAMSINISRRPAINLI
ncbi:outer membrane protein [Salmonella enterica subsp. enterica]|uniref:Outer membrane protein n=1 Tax=Salmonella enterica I TaxID=59201 RepID=A0A3S4JC34_SALET|nr:outer membrane protein [Salmonella enterica subsp. enterica]